MFKGDDEFEDLFSEENIFYSKAHDMPNMSPISWKYTGVIEKFKRNNDNKTFRKNKQDFSNKFEENKGEVTIFKIFIQ